MTKKLLYWTAFYVCQHTYPSTELLYFRLDDMPGSLATTYTSHLMSISILQYFASKVTEATRPLPLLFAGPDSQTPGR
jgi:hypothetical protein